MLRCAFHPRDNSVSNIDTNGTSRLTRSILWCKRYMNWAELKMLAWPLHPTLHAAVAWKSLAARNATRISVSAHRGLLEGTLP